MRKQTIRDEHIICILFPVVGIAFSVASQTCVSQSRLQWAKDDPIFVEK